MPIKNSTDKSPIKQEIINVSILICITLFLGVFLIATTVVISKDSTIFIDYAKKLEVSPTQAMIQEYQHPGYPILILGAAKITGLRYKGSQLFLFIYSAQAVSLLFRILTIVLLYFLGKELIGKKFSFWAVLILVILPKPAEYGSDALSDWPNLFFITLGMLLLYYGAKYNKWWLFALTGIAGGMAYLIRPEGAQVIIYGVWWLGLQLFWKKRTLTKSRAATGLASMVIIFTLIVLPYMKLKGAIFPKKNVGTFSSLQQFENQDTHNESNPKNFAAEIVPSKIGGAFLKIFENIGDTLMWFFLIPYLIGAYQYFKKKKLLEPEQFFIITLIIINIPLMIWLHCSHGYMSGRHTLTLVIFTIFFIPIGLQSLATLLNTKYSRGYEHTHRWFAILMTIGIGICIPKLFMPLHSDKIVYRDAARLLSKNTESSAIVGVPDYRISFYAQRTGIKILDENIPEVVEYLVKIVKKDEGEITPMNFQRKFSLESNDGKKEILIFKRVTQ